MKYEDCTAHVQDVYVMGGQAERVLPGKRKLSLVLSSAAEDSKEPQRECRLLDAFCFFDDLQVPIWGSLRSVLKECLDSYICKLTSCMGWGQASQPSVAGSIVNACTLLLFYTKLEARGLHFASL